MYKLVKDNLLNKMADIVFRISDSTFIPFDPANTDYQEYLRWLKQGNKPLPADEPPVS